MPLLHIVFKSDRGDNIGEIYALHRRQRMPLYEDDCIHTTPGVICFHLKPDRLLPHPKAKKLKLEGRRTSGALFTRYGKSLIQYSRKIYTLHGRSKIGLTHVTVHNIRYCH